MVQSWKDCVVMSHREFESRPVRHKLYNQASLRDRSERSISLLVLLVDKAQSKKLANKAQLNPF